MCFALEIENFLRCLVVDVQGSSLHFFVVINNGQIVRVASQLLHEVANETLVFHFLLLLAVTIHLRDS